MNLEVPTLDLQRFDNDREAFISDMGNAYREFGFCCFSNHGISPEETEKTYRAYKEFFGLPEDEKKKYISEKMPGTRGYTPFKVETAKTQNLADLKEFWHVGREISGHNPHPDILIDNIWPARIPDFKDCSLSLYNHMENVCAKILSAIAADLNLPLDFFADKSDFGNSTLRVLHYPPINESDLPAIRASAHEDISMITLLVGATESGLELLARNGQWVAVKPKDGAVIVNIGDMLQRLTNHVYPSTTHRVVNPTGEKALVSRYSMPFFMDPNPDFLIETLPSCITEENPNRYPSPITADDYLTQRLHEINMPTK